MKLTKAWLATCCRCKTTTQVYRDGANITQAQAVRKLRAGGWSTSNGEPYCPDCSAARPSVIEVIKTLKSAGKGGD